jgi:ABC-2 type transport system ATP-binding protein
MTNGNVIHVSELEVKYDKTTILKNITLDIKKGEIVGFLGPSGSGKTTLVKALIGMKAPAKGEIEVLGRKMPSLEAIAEVGYMAQSDALYEDLTALDNLLFFGELYNLKGKAAKARAIKLLELVDLEKDAHKAVKNYSGGMRRRLSLAIALIHSPELLILDEPTVGIDPLLRRSFWNEFDRIKNNGGSIIVTTHVMDEAYRCDRLALIRDGEIIADGTPEEIISAAGTKDIEEAFLYYSNPKQEV